MKSALPPEVERGATGLRVRDHALVLDPRGRPPLGFVAHARGSFRVLPERTIATAQTLALLESAAPRALKKSAALPALYGQHFALGGLRLTAHPAGFVLGSAQLRVEGVGLDLVYAGDLGGAGALTAEPRAQLECETLALHAHYGARRFRFPPREESLQKAFDFVRETLRAGERPVLYASPIGATQELLRYFDGRHLLRLHPAAHRACEAYIEQGVALTGYARLEEPGDVLVLPPGNKLPLPPNARVRTLTGQDRPDAIRFSEHADFHELLDYALKSQAQRVLIISTQAEELVQALRDKGREAMPIRDGRQLTLPGF